MQLWRFLTPKALGFAAKMAREELVDRITNAPPRVFRARDYVAQHAQRNDPEDVLRTLDRFAVEVGRRQPNGFICVRYEGRIGVGIDIDRHAANTHVVRAAHHAPRDLSPIRYQQSGEAHSLNTP